jgi:hypothetical protein
MRESIAQQERLRFEMEEEQRQREEEAIQAQLK